MCCVIMEDAPFPGKREGTGVQRKFGCLAQRSQSQGSWCKWPKDTRALLALALSLSLLKWGETGLMNDKLFCSFMPSSIKPDTRLAHASAWALIICCLNCLTSCLNDLPVSSLSLTQFTPTHPAPSLPATGQSSHCEAKQVSLPKKTLECPHVACRKHILAPKWIWKRGSSPPSWYRGF